MIRARANARVTCVAIVVLFLLAALMRDIWLQVAACALLGAFVAAGASVVIGTSCEVDLDYPSALEVGVPAEACFTVRNTTNRPSRPMLMRYALVARRELVPELTVYVESLRPGAHVVVRAAILPRARGESVAGRWTIEKLGAFGLLSSRLVRATDLRVQVAPRAVPPIDRRIDGTGADGAGPARDGLDVRGVRAWRPGDGVRHVHWRTTARAGHLTVLDRGEPSRPALGVLLAGEAGDREFESKLASVAATVQRALDDGVECYAVVGQPGRCSPPLSRESASSLFASVESSGPIGPHDVEELVASVGHGATLLVAVPGEDVPTAWRDALLDAVHARGVAVVVLRAVAA